MYCLDRHLWRNMHRREFPLWWKFQISQKLRFRKKKPDFPENYEFFWASKVCGGVLKSLKLSLLLKSKFVAPLLLLLSKMSSSWISRGGDGSSVSAIVVKWHRNCKLGTSPKISVLGDLIRLASFRWEVMVKTSMTTNICIRVWRIHFQRPN
jgi:hypothetical protein